MQWHDDKLTLDLNRDRIRTVLRETYETCRTVLGTSLDISADEFVARIEPYLLSNRIALMIPLELSNSKFPGLTIEVDLKRASVFARIPSRARNHPRQVELNRYLKSL